MSLMSWSSLKCPQNLQQILHGVSPEILALLKQQHYPVGICLPKVNSRNIRTRCKICSKLTINTPELHWWRGSGVFIVNFEHISPLVLVFLLLTLNAGWVYWHWFVVEECTIKNFAEGKKFNSFSNFFNSSLFKLIVIVKIISPP